ncbi:MAG: TolC family protein [Planctomycetaceae bacterium]
MSWEASSVCRSNWAGRSRIPASSPSPQGAARLNSTTRNPCSTARAAPSTPAESAWRESNSTSHTTAAIQLQDHLLKVTEAYWELYRARTLFLQRHRLLMNAVDIEQALGGRQGGDVSQQRLLRAKAAVAGRRAQILRAATDIRNAESRLRLLVNDPGLSDVGYLELITEEAPNTSSIPLSMTGSLQTALLHRPDISHALRQLQAASVKSGVAKNDLLPRLDLVLRSYVAGLEGIPMSPRRGTTSSRRVAPATRLAFCTSSRSATARPMPATPVANSSTVRRSTSSAPRSRPP